MALYFLRHAQAPGNAENVWVGRNDQPLSEQGLRMLQEVAISLASMSFRRVFTSPLQRAHATAQAIADQQNDCELIIREGLQERDFGRFEGCSKTPARRQLMEADDSVESIASMQLRIGRVLDEAAALPGNTLLVSHAAVYRCIVQTMGLQPAPVRAELANLEWCELHDMSEAD